MSNLVIYSDEKKIEGLEWNAFFHCFKIEAGWQNDWRNRIFEEVEIDLENINTFKTEKKG